VVAVVGERKGLDRPHSGGYLDIIRCNDGKERRIVIDPAPDQEVKDAGNVTHLLLEWGNGDDSALERLTPIIYDELLRLARARLSKEKHAYTLQPTALVHECYLRLADQSRLQLHNRAHFYAVAANTMRRVLIDNARKRNAEKRGGGVRITLQTGMDVAEDRTADVTDLDEALQKLTAFDERKGRVIELKFFGGMTAEEIGMVIGISVATVGRELRLGQAWLRRELSRS